MPKLLPHRRPNIWNLRNCRRSFLDHVKQTSGFQNAKRETARTAEVGPTRGPRAELGTDCRCHGTMIVSNRISNNDIRHETSTWSIHTAHCSPCTKCRMQSSMHRQHSRSWDCLQILLQQAEGADCQNPKQISPCCGSSMPVPREPNVIWPI